MSRSAALGLLRQASTSFSTRQTTPALAQARQLLHRRRYAAQNGEPPLLDSPKAEEAAESSSASASSNNKDGSTAAEPSKEAELAAKLKAKEAEVVDLTGRLRYLQADFLNLQRNAAREKEHTRDYAISRFASDLLETVDVLSLALKSVPESALKPPSSASPPRDNSSTPSPSTTTPTTDADGSSGFFTSKNTPSAKSAQDHLIDLHSGVELTHKQLLQTLFKYGVKPFDPTGDKFDPNRHEALYQAPVPGKKPGTVLECQSAGYTIKGRTLRAAKVGVVADAS